MKNTLIISLLFGVSLLSCQKDPCAGITCENDAECVNGICDCPPQYTGPSCGQEVPPNKMIVAAITLLDYPPTDSGGAGWDLFDGPDVFITISKGGVELYQSTFVEDLTAEDYGWTVNFEFTDPEATYNISVWDYDDGLTADDFMGGANFTPYKSGKDFPEFFFVCEGCPVSFQFAFLSYFH